MNKEIGPALLDKRSFMLDTFVEAEVLHVVLQTLFERTVDAVVLDGTVSC